MTKEEARDRMLLALAAAGVDGVDTDSPDFPGRCAEYWALRDALKVLAGEVIAVQSDGRWRFSDAEFARRILRAIGVDATAERIDAIAGVLRGLQ